MQATTRRTDMRPFYLPGVLKQAGLTRDRPSGRTVRSSADPQGLAPLIDWIGVYGASWRDRFDRLLDRREL